MLRIVPGERAEAARRRSALGVTMTDQPPPDGGIAAEHDLAAERPARPARPAGARWRARRIPLAIAGGALLLGCVLGAGVAAVAVVAGDWTHRVGADHSVS